MQTKKGIGLGVYIKLHAFQKFVLRVRWKWRRRRRRAARGPVARAPRRGARATRPRSAAMARAPTR